MIRVEKAFEYEKAATNPQIYSPKGKHIVTGTGSFRLLWLLKH